ncbi:MAG: hypothetical protein R3C19_22410 [Planctomycetaceae bacterium]
MVHWPRAAVAFFWLFSPAAAQINDFTWDPPDPVMGELVTYTAVTQGNTQPVQSYSWEYRYTSGPCQDPWHTGYWANGAEWLSPEPRPGTWEVKLTVTYQSPGQDPVSGMMLPPPPPSVIIKPLTVAPATKIVVVAGHDEKAPVTGQVIFRFRVESATRPCGPFLGSVAMAQEKMTNVTFVNPPFGANPDDSDWAPTGGSTPEFGFPGGGNEIVDIQDQSGFETIWPAIVFRYMRAEQHLRLKYTDPCGQIQHIVLGTVIHVRVKENATEWRAFGTVVVP